MTDTPIHDALAAQHGAPAPDGTITGDLGDTLIWTAREDDGLIRCTPQDTRADVEQWLNLQHDDVNAEPVQITARDYIAAVVAQGGSETHARQNIEHLLARRTLPTVCISGSMRGEWAMRRHAADLYAAGHPVLYPWPLPADGAHTVDPAVTHRRQIDLADVMHVVTVGGYLCDHTRGEIAYAEQAGIPVEPVDFAGGSR